MKIPNATINIKPAVSFDSIVMKIPNERIKYVRKFCSPSLYLNNASITILKPKNDNVSLFTPAIVYVSIGTETIIPEYKRCSGNKLIAL